MGSDARRELLVKLRQEEGFGLITALMISFVVFILAALWYGISTHEIDQAAGDRAAAMALNSAEAGAREMMYVLANDKTVRDSLEVSGAVYTTSPEGNACVYDRIDSSGTASDSTFATG
jgi:Tfp pilus assembly protein PilX